MPEVLPACDGVRVRSGHGGRLCFPPFLPLLFMPRYDDYSGEGLERLLEARDRGDATRIGLVWETNEVEREKALRFGLGRGLT